MNTIKIHEGIQIGLRTHIQLHEIISNNFKVIKIKVSNPQNPTPQFVFAELLLFISVYFSPGYFILFFRRCPF